MNKKRSSVKTHERTRRTPQKLAILAHLEGNTAHPSAEEIHKALLLRFPTMSLSTVYTTLRALQRQGRIHELPVEPGKGRFDPEPAPHHHLVCLDCRKVVDVHRRFAVTLRKKEARGFRVLHAHVGFFGLCAGCQANAKTKS